MEQEIWEALENAAPGAHKDHKTTTTKNEITIYKNSILRFLGDLDDSLTVREVIQGLENYRGE